MNKNVNNEIICSTSPIGNNRNVKNTAKFKNETNFWRVFPTNWNEQRNDTLPTASSHSIENIGFEIEFNQEMPCHLPRWHVNRSSDHLTKPKVKRKRRFEKTPLMSKSRRRRRPPSKTNDYCRQGHHRRPSLFRFLVQKTIVKRKIWLFFHSL